MLGGTAEFGIEDVSAVCKTHLVDVDEAVCGRPCVDIDEFVSFCLAMNELQMHILYFENL